MTTIMSEYTNQPIIDLNIRKMLEKEYGIDRNLAEAITITISTQNISNLATKSDISELRNAINELRIMLKSDMKD